ncbi:ABC transporter ATP-binding protein [Acidobacteriota bacterium]
MNNGFTIRGVSKGFRSGSERVEVLRDIDLAVPKGELLGIMGPSGVGKSTLLHILGGLERPDSGLVLYDDRDIFALGASEIDAFRNRHVGFVFQFHYLLPEFTAQENVMMPCLIQGMDSTQTKKRSRELLEAVGLVDRASHRPGELSGGEQQRVAVARALANNPPVLLADEPTGNLDSQTGGMIFDMFLDLHRERELTTIVVTHNEGLALRCHRVLRLERGMIAEES